MSLNRIFIRKFNNQMYMMQSTKAFYYDMKL